MHSTPEATQLHQAWLQAHRVCSKALASCTLGGGLLNNVNKLVKAAQDWKLEAPGTGSASVRL